MPFMLGRPGLPAAESGVCWIRVVILCFCGVSWCFAAEQPRSVPVANATIAEIDRLVSAEYAGSPYGSITIGIVSSNGLVWAKSYGAADVENKTPATPETVYRIGGMTMQFTALMLLQLVERNVVQLSDPVEKYVPEIRQARGGFSDARPTLEQLALHSSGLASEPDLPVYSTGPAADWEKILLDALPHTQFIARPGSAFEYSSVGYAVLALALSRAARQPYFNYLKEHIFKPLKMFHTAFIPDSEMTPLLAKGYNLTVEHTLDGAKALREQAGRGIKAPGGGLYTTVGDLAQFLKFELGHGPSDVLSERVLMENYKKRVPTLDSHNGRHMLGYGIGFQIMRGDGHPFIGHGGEVPGYHARADFAVESQTGFIILRNVGGGSLHLSTLKLAGDCLQLLKDPAADQGKKVSTQANTKPRDIRRTRNEKIIPI